MRTLLARGPLGLDSISNETFSPPWRPSKSPSVPLRWKKYSCPSSALMNPKPRSETSFLMVPVGISISYLSNGGAYSQLAGPFEKIEACGERRRSAGYTGVYPDSQEPIPAASESLLALDWSTSVRWRLRSLRRLGVTSRSSSSARKSSDCSRLSLEAGVSLTEMSDVEDRMFDCFFSRHTLTRMSPGLFWMPTIMPS